MEIICRICRKTRKELIQLFKIVPNSHELEIEGEKFEYCLGLKVLEIVNYPGICAICKKQLNDFYTFKQQAIKSHYKLLEITLKSNTFNNDETQIKSESLNNLDDFDNIEDDGDSLILDTMDRFITKSDNFSDNLSIEETAFENKIEKIEEIEKLDDTDLYFLEISLDGDRDFSTENYLILNQNKEEVLSSKSPMFNNEFIEHEHSDIYDDGSKANMSNSLSANGEPINIINNNLESNEETPESSIDQINGSIILKEFLKQKNAHLKSALKTAEDISQMHCDEELQKNPSVENSQEEKETRNFENTENSRDCSESLYEKSPSNSLETFKEDNSDKFKRTKKTVEKMKKYKCNICNKKFKIKAIFEAHVNEHKGLPAYQCEICGKTFQFECRKSYNLHLEYHRFSDKFESRKKKCDFCDRNFESKTLLEAHMNEHKGLPAYQCNICGKAYKFECRTYYSEHMKDHQGIPRRFKCELCPQSFHRRRDFNIHMSRHKNDRPLVCEICGRRFSLIVYLKRHLETHEENKNHKCDICHKSFRLKCVLLVHKREIHQPKRFICKICNKEFGRKQYYQRHMIKSHRNLKDQEYQQNEGPFICIGCEKEFNDYDTLKDHESKTHLPKQVCYNCERCGKTFSMKRYYESHIPKCEIYLGDTESPYECKICGKIFKRRNPYIDHLQNSHNLECHICHKIFKAKYTLKAHMRNVHLPKPFSCGMCNINFSRKHQFEKHVEKNHRDLVDVLFSETNPGKSPKCNEFETSQSQEETL